MAIIVNVVVLKRGNWLGSDPRNPQDISQCPDFPPLDKGAVREEISVFLSAESKIDKSQ